MTVEPTTPPVADPKVPSGDDGDSNPLKPDSVSYETHRRLLSEKKELAAKLAAYEADKKAREEKELTEKGEYQKLLELEREEKAKLQANLSAREQKDIVAKKVMSVRRALGGKVNDKWLSQIDYDQVVINPDTGEVDEMSVTKAAEAFKKEWPEAFIDPNLPKQPTDAPQGNGGNTITMDAWKKLPAKEMAKWKPSQIIG